MEVPFGGAGGGRQEPSPVGAGVGEEVGLVVGDHGHAEPARRPRPAHPQGRGRGEVDDVGVEVAEPVAHPGRERGDGEVGVDAAADAGHPYHLEAVALLHAGSRGEEQGAVAAAAQVSRQGGHCAGDTVDPGQEALGDDGQTHPTAIVAAGWRRSGEPTFAIW